MLRRMFSFYKPAHYAALLLYTMLAAGLLLYVEASIVWTMLLLSVIPILVLWRLERLQTAMLPIVSLVAIGGAAALEAAAYVNGIWYEITPLEWRLFDLVPVESFLVAFIHLVYFIVVYEYFFDDRQNRGTAPRQWPLLGAAAMLLFSGGLAYLYLFSGLIIANAYAWVLLLILCLAILALVVAVRGNWRRVLQKSAAFGCLMLPVGLAYESVALANNLRFFANTPEYLYTFTIGGQLIPLEEFLFVLLIPIVTVLVYELYLDDGA